MARPASLPDDAGACAVDLYRKYGLRRVLNAYDKATTLGGARVSPAVTEAVACALGDNFLIEQLQEVAGHAIADATDAEAGCVTACAAAGIALGVAAAMTGCDRGKIAQLPDAEGMANRVLLQKGHAVSFGTPVTQMIRLSGAQVVEVGTANVCQPWHIQHEIDRGNVAAIVAVESYHTRGYGGLDIGELAKLARPANVPVIVDAATQELRLAQLVASGADMVICSAHKYLCATTAGVIAGRRALIDAVLLHHAGIGRPMKVGKEGIIGVIAAFESSPWSDVKAWSANEDRKVARLIELLSDLPGIHAHADPDPNGCPFARVRVTLDRERASCTPEQLRARLAEGDPAVFVRAYPFDPAGIYLNTTELTDDEVECVARAVGRVAG